MTYKVKLEIFEGPLDLLLFLIKKNELDIYNIPVAEITKQYLEYLELMRYLDLNIAGEYIVVAATLMHIKSKMLLPPEETESVEEVEEEDPRAELVRRLLEYQKFKGAAGHFEEMELQQKNVFTRSPQDIRKFKDDPKDIYFEASLFDLLSAFSKVLKEIPKEKFQEVIKDKFTVTEKIHRLLHRLMEEEVIFFTKLFKKAKDKYEIIVTFLAILELMRLKEIVIIQEMPFGEIQIRRNTEQIQPKLRNATG